MLNHLSDSVGFSDLALLLNKASNFSTLLMRYAIASGISLKDKFSLIIFLMFSAVGFSGVPITRKPLLLGGIVVQKDWVNKWCPMGNYYLPYLPIIFELKY